MVQQKCRQRQRSRCTRFRVGRVSIYFHHSAWWVYYRQNEKQVRRRIGDGRAAAERVAAEVNAQLTVAAPTMFDFRPVGVDQLSKDFLEYHEHVLRSSVATICRYRAAIQHLVNYAASLPRLPAAHEVSATGFVALLRRQKVSPNGHSQSARRL